jgi:hypothetical protein
MTSTTIKTLKQIEQIDRIVSQAFPLTGSLSQAGVKEEINGNDEVERKKQEIERLKDRNRIEKDRNRSLTNQIKTLKSRKN